MTEQNWEEVIKLAEKNEFIHFCYAGVAVLMTKENKEKAIALQNKLGNKVLNKFTRINRKGLLTDDDLEKINNIIDKAINERRRIYESNRDCEEN